MDNKGFAKILIIIIIVLLLLIIIGGAAAVYFIFFRDKEESPIEKRPDPMIVQQLNKNGFRVNVAETDYSVILLASISVGYADKKMGKELASRQVQIEDIVDGVLSSWTMEEFAEDKDRSKLKKELADKINAVLKTGEIQDVYITEFLIQ